MKKEPRNLLLIVALGLLLSCGDAEPDPAPAASASGGAGGSGCPTGQVEGPSGDCMAVGIQGCADMFVEGDNLCHPRADKCPAGTIPKFAEGCVPVGIPGCAASFMEDDGLCHPSIDKCPAGTIPRFSEGCVPVGIQGCPGEFMEADGLCHPTMDKCSNGTFAAPLEGCLPIDGATGCGAGPWGNIPDGPDTVWVDPTYGGGDSDGTKSKPVLTIAAALALVPAGGRIALAAGSYDESVKLTSPVEIVGRCPSMVTLSGVQPAFGFTAIVWVEQTNGVTLQNLRISGGGIGLLADGAEVVLEGLHIQEASIAGVLAANAGADVSVVRSLIEGTVQDQGYGQGIYVMQGAQLALQSSAVVHNDLAGVIVADANSEMTATGSLVEGTQPDPNDQTYGGDGVYVANAGRAIIESCAVVRNHTTGLQSATGDLTISSSLVEGTLSVDGLAGGGMQVAWNGVAAMTSCAVIDNHTTGIVAYDSGEIGLVGSLVRGTQPHQSGEYGLGFLLFDAARATIDSSAVVGSRNYGIYAQLPDTEISVSSTLIEGTLPGDAPVGRGIQVMDGATGTLASVAVVGNHEGLTAMGGAELAVTDSLIADSQLQGDPKGGRGIDITSGAHGTVQGTAVVHTHDLGITAMLADSEVTVIDSLVAHTQPLEHGGATGAGIWLQAGARGTVEGTTVLDSRAVGMASLNEGTELVVTSSLVEQTFPQLADGRFGNGLYVGVGARATLTSSAVVRSHHAGVQVAGELTQGTQQLVVNESLIDDTLPQQDDGGLGFGVACSHGLLTLTSTVVRRSHVGAVLLWRCTGELTDCLLRETLAGHFFSYDPDGTSTKYENVGDGLLVSVSTATTVHNTRIEGCARAGLLFDESPGTLTNVMSTNNRFGLSLQGDPLPSYDETCAFEGNLEKDILSDGTLPVPSAPPEMPEAPQ